MIKPVITKLFLTDIQLSRVTTTMVNMSNSQAYVSVPVYHGFLKIVIWHEPDSVSKASKICKIKKYLSYISRLSVAMVYCLQILF